ncbi:MULTISPECIES: acyl-ACP--UDP-N-acetylglucosamine O-acyltransferase [Roseivirga]|jgi:UDP-N-acetylglucosamine acyltransferase|uniref:Acyl-[acyl-carrier-protein]--UDP-N-acetylglucosamine O-acyltransferase n=1 Tax=Roseivirga spongicola TaxID=333140 RepID=A0A150XAF0_9BACT|nr:MULTISPECIES: acyl-ACP--UDP-N-acetylglucosamine O-acyltransferase [Roseivirga]PWL29289.1 MAG: acyl-ACP--UDP-N-acetylglucosamine O-acyltransferase [Roseivirga sp. XM-24bin3]KYG75705.1 acyl-[acyl-carrier-protein]--UDP-N-acetylglucosamine O-acyltransferase [Roseivirga spongicola]MBO6494799.1 acyl-ACP--UDP-N-acetylglucosamine O-acyltransferase [Roseivirga sp.]MBO6662471.1 acyl-ACP--UDP-N-acetylglucosamine O-acyltransferase [Roseivirga sp.]MBO6909965.1 acyl-ACP--UDP-N-acetylglucosamine O-acyltra
MNQPLAYIHREAKIARNVVIEPFVTISKNVVIEEGSWIGSNVTIMEGARIGKNVKIFPGAVVSAVPQDLKFGGEDTTLEIGDNTVIRECVTLNRGTDATNKTVIGKNCLIMAYTHVAHDCMIGDNCILVNAVQLAGHVTIDDWAIIGGAAAVHQFVNIGAHTMVSGGSLVRKDVPPYTKAGREPLSYAGINSIGLRRRGFANEKIAEIQEIYRYIFLKGLNNSKALDLVELEMTPSKERDEIINFFRNSDRGVMKGYSAK